MYFKCLTLFNIHVGDVLKEKKTENISVKKNINEVDKLHNATFAFREY